MAPNSETLKVLMVVTYIVTWMSWASAFDLTILHTNDVHARIEETNKYSGTCTDDDSAQGKCYGGAARIRTMVNQKRAQYPNSLLLDGGDQFQGTLWYFEFGGWITSQFMNLIGYDAMAIGNHEFDDGIDGLVPFASNITFDLLSANANLSQTPQLRDLVKKSTVFNISGELIGVIGYTTVETASISSPETVTFIGELNAIQAEADKLMSQGINKIIAVGHAGFHVDLELGKNLNGVDIIVGGHTNTFLYNGSAPSNEDPVGEYPYLVENQHDGQVLIVHDYAYGKYLGELHVTFDDSGKVTSWSGNPVLLDNSVAKDPETEELIQQYLPRLDALKTSVIGKSHVRFPVEGAICRIRECSLGNMIADAMVHQNLRASDSMQWADVAIAVINGGGIRAPLEKGDITIENALFVQPFRNTVDIVVLTGQTILDLFEFGASQWTDQPEAAGGGFLQVSGIKIIYDMRRPDGAKVVQILVRCSDCLVPKMEPLNLSKHYKILMSSFIALGGDGYKVIADNIVEHHIIGTLDSDITMEYLKSQSPVYTGLEGRIQFLDEMERSGLYDYLKDDCMGNKGANDTLSTKLFQLVIMFVLSTVARNVL